MEKYDEDIYENPFFIALQNEHTSLFEEAASLRCTLCIPRYAAAEKETLTREDFEDHILVPQNKEDTYKTWSGKDVAVAENRVKFNSTQCAVLILFEEIFYNKKDESYRVICLQSLLNRCQTDEDTKTPEVASALPKSFEECKALLFQHHGGKKLQETLERQLESFSGSYSRLASAKFINIVDAAHTHFTKAMQTVLKDASIRRRVHDSKSEMDNLKSAVEVYMINFVHRSLFQAIQINVASEDAEINKHARNLADIKLEDLGVRPEFNQNIRLTRKELLKLNKYSTPLGRLLCLKRVVSCLSSPTKMESANGQESSLMMTTDDFLPIMIYLIIKSEMPNWMANLKFMKDFHFSRSYNFDEFMFYLTTVEAAIEHIRSGTLQKEAIRSYTLQKTEMAKQISGAVKSVDRFFHYVECGDEAAVRIMLGKPDTADNQIVTKMCHPLCSCNKCRALQRQHATEKNLVTAYTRDDHGYTALHIAALHGQAHLVDLLVQHGAVVDTADYLGLTPLHLACQKGYQNIILLLIHFGTDCTLKDGVGNTPLHLCVDSGHEDCVKALVFTDKTRTHIDIDAQNSRGDTPLHLAAKWGYEVIIHILLDNYAQTGIKNRKKQTPFSLAQNTNIQRIFLDHDSQPKLVIVKPKSETLSEYDVVKVVQPDPPKSFQQQSPSSPTKLFTPEVASLDQAEHRQISLLYKAIEDGDIPLVQYYMKWNSISEKETQSLVSIEDLCHPLCQCSKCSNLEQNSSTSDSLHVNITDNKLFTPLHKACQAQNLDLVKMFVGKGAKVNVQTLKEITPLHLATINGDSEIVLFLLKNDAKVNAKDSFGDTSLHLSCYKGVEKSVEYLLQYQAKLSITNSIGNSPLHIAVKTGNEAIIKRLLQAGAYPLARNNQKQTPFDVTQNAHIRDILNTHITKKPCSPTEDTSPKVVKKESLTIKELFSAFEEKDLETLQKLTSSIRSFDRKENLKHAPTMNDNSAPDLRRIRHSISIQKFNLSALRHVQSLDKSEPLHIYKLASKEMETLTEKDRQYAVEDEARDKPNHIHVGVTDNIIQNKDSETEITDLDMRTVTGSHRVVDSNRENSGKDLTDIDEMHLKM